VKALWGSATRFYAAAGPQILLNRLSEAKNRVTVNRSRHFIRTRINRK